MNGFLALVGFVTLLFLALLALAGLALWLLRDGTPGVIDDDPEPVDMGARIEPFVHGVRVVEPDPKDAA